MKPCLGTFYNVNRAPDQCQSEDMHLQLKYLTCTFRGICYRRKCSNRLQVRFQYAQNALSPDACRSKFMSYVFTCALARRLSIEMRFLYAQMRSRLTPVSRNAFSIRSSVLSLHSRRSNCVSYVLKCALARRLPIYMCFYVFRCA